jgi:hypothetical protein
MSADRQPPIAARSGRADHGSADAEAILGSTNEGWYDETLGDESDADAHGISGATIASSSATRARSSWISVSSHSVIAMSPT